MNSGQHQVGCFDTDLHCPPPKFSCLCFFFVSFLRPVSLPSQVLAKILKNSLKLRCMSLKKKCLFAWHIFLLFTLTAWWQSRCYWGPYLSNIAYICYVPPLILPSILRLWNSPMKYFFESLTFRPATASGLSVHVTAVEKESATFLRHVELHVWFDQCTFPFWLCFRKDIFLWTTDYFHRKFLCWHSVNL